MIMLSFLRDVIVIFHCINSLTVKKFFPEMIKKTHWIWSNSKSDEYRQAKVTADRHYGDLECPMISLLYTRVSGLSNLDAK